MRGEFHLDLRDSCLMERMAALIGVIYFDILIAVK